MTKIIPIYIFSLIVFAIITVNFSGCTESKEVQQFISDFESLSLNDTEEKAISVLGNPDSIEEEFRAGQKIGNENLYSKAKTSYSEYYLVWERGIDLVFCIGIGQDREIKIKEYTGT